MRALRLPAPALPTKAEMLHALAPRLARSHVPPLVYWTVGEWRAYRAEILAAVVATFAQPVAVRSATLHEDLPGSRRAGHYRTELGIAPHPVPLACAIERVIAAYGDGAAGHHVLVQAMVDDAKRSGVVLTRDPATGAPYDVIELTEGRATDAVTGGWGRPTRVAIHHGADRAAIAESGHGAIVAATRDAADVVGASGPLELEMIERDDGTIALVQVRCHAPLDAVVAARDRAHADRVTRLAAEVEAIARPTRPIAGSTTVLGMMPDWNPAELIGAHPAPLAAALFRDLIADRTWQEARAAMGYQPVAATPLVHLVAGRPYVDVRASFNSFLPAGLPLRTRHALVDAWIDRLRRHPELHDRVELEVAQTAFDFATRAAVRRLDTRLAPAARDEWLAALRALTRHAIDGGPAAALPRALRRLATLAPAWPGARPPAPAPTLPAILALVRHCRTAGARPFAMVARHAFMAEGFLRSLVARGAMSPARALSFRRSLTTVAGRFVADSARMARGEAGVAALVEIYGHLRPGAFDVTSLPYAQRDRSFWEGLHVGGEAAAPFVASAAEEAALARLLAEVRLGIDPRALLAWMAAAIVGREQGKFLLTRGLSAALEGLAAWGAAHGFERDDLAWLTLANLRRAGTRPDREAMPWLAARVAAARTRATEERRLRLGPLIRDARDLFVVHEPPALPTFVTDRTIVAPPVLLDGRAAADRDLAGRIACVESADPGFDWVFGRSVGGLVTRFGGANSHMAIRCVELGVPAALGVGESAFERLRDAPLIELRCAERAVRAAEASA